jgi:adenosylhomocysteine nucleosidase
MKTIGIIGAMDLEIKLLIENMNLFKQEKAAGFDYYIGTIQGKDVVVTCCGVGKVNAAACTQALIDRYKVDAIINTGIAGGLHHEVKICDVVISKDVTYHDVRKGQMRSLFPFKECFEGDRELIDLATKACKLTIGDEYNHHLGRIVSGECFVSDANLKRTIVEQYSPHCVEMEGAAIGHVAHINDIPFVVIRSISDNADDEANISYDAFEKIAAEQAANIILNMIKML